PVELDLDYSRPRVRIRRLAVDRLAVRTRSERDEVYGQPVWRLNFNWRTLERKYDEIIRPKMCRYEGGLGRKVVEEPAAAVVATIIRTAHFCFSATRNIRCSRYPSLALMD